MKFSGSNFGNTLLSLGHIDLSVVRESTRDTRAVQASPITVNNHSLQKLWVRKSSTKLLGLLKDLHLRPELPCASVQQLFTRNEALLCISLLAKSLKEPTQWFATMPKPNGLRLNTLCAAHMRSTSDECLFLFRETTFLRHIHFFPFLLLNFSSEQIRISDTKIAWSLYGDE